MIMRALLIKVTKYCKAFAVDKIYETIDRFLSEAERMESDQ